MFQLVRRNTEEDKTVHWKNYRSLGREESGITRDPAGGDSVRRVGGVLRIFAADRLLRSGAAAFAVLSNFSQRHRSGKDFHSVFTLGGSGSAALRTHQFAARRRRLARVVGNLPFSYRRHGSQPVQALRAGTVSAFFLWFVELAVRTTAGMLLGIQPGSGFHGVRALRSPARCVARTQSAQTWPAFASSAGGGVGRGALSLARLAAQRQLWHLARGGGVFEGSLGVAAGKTCATRGACRCWLF